MVLGGLACAAMHSGRDGRTGNPDRFAFDTGGGADAVAAYPEMHVAILPGNGHGRCPLAPGQRPFRARKLPVERKRAVRERATRHCRQREQQSGPKGVTGGSVYHSLTIDVLLLQGF
jgi:hypothetical protein